MSIRKKFLISFLSAAIIPLILLAVANTIIFKTQAKKDALSKVRITLQGAERIYYAQANELKNAFLISNYNLYFTKSLIGKKRQFLDSLVYSYKSAFNYADLICVLSRYKTVLASSSGKTDITLMLNGLINKSFSRNTPIVKTVYIKNYTQKKLGLNHNNTGSSINNLFLVTVVPITYKAKVVGGILGFINLYKDSYIPRTIYNDYHMNPAIFSSIFQTQTAISTMNIPGNVFGVGSKLPFSIYKKISSGMDYIDKMNYEGKNVFVAFHPIKDINNKVIGSLGVLISNHEYVNLLKKTAIYSILIIIFGLIISLIITYFASKDTLNPIYMTLDAIKKFSSGELDTRLIIKTNDEFEKIGKGFTEMAINVHDREERMLKYNEFSDFLTKSLNFDYILSGTLDKLEELTDSVSGIIYEAVEITNKKDIQNDIKETGLINKNIENNKLNGYDDLFESNLNKANNNANDYNDNYNIFVKDKYKLVPKKYYGIRKFVAKEFNLDEGIVGECITKKKTIWFHDIPENAILLKDQLLSDGANGKTIDYGFCEVFPKDIVWLPLYIESSSKISIPLGVIMLSSLKGFKKEDIVFLEHAVKELSITLDNAKMHQKLNKLSITDELMGLYNRRYLNEFLERELNLAKRHNTQLSLLMMDIDNFKHVNDFYGHQLGDEVLRTAGQIIKDSIRSTDFGARYGGEEFTVVLPYTDFGGSFEVAKKIKEQLSKYQFKGLVENVTISIGIVNYPDCEEFNYLNHDTDTSLKTNNINDGSNAGKINTIDNLLKIADDFLYEAKSNGKNCIVGINKGNKIIFK
ncbi:MAG: diguanylate cyclase [bacterium]